MTETSDTVIAGLDPAIQHCKALDPSGCVDPRVTPGDDAASGVAETLDTVIAGLDPAIHFSEGA
ncbi:MAG: hypothetical protein AAF416_11390 [Pseudomonadota bacterium]